MNSSRKMALCMCSLRQRHGNWRRRHAGGKRPKTRESVFLCHCRICVHVSISLPELIHMINAFSELVWVLLGSACLWMQVVESDFAKNLAQLRVAEATAKAGLHRRQLAIGSLGLSMCHHRA